MNAREDRFKASEFKIDEHLTVLKNHNVKYINFNTLTSNIVQTIKETYEEYNLTLSPEYVIYSKTSHFIEGTLFTTDKLFLWRACYLLQTRFFYRGYDIYYRCYFYTGYVIHSQTIYFIEGTLFNTGKLFLR